MNISTIRLRTMYAAVLAATLPLSAAAAGPVEALQQQIDALQKQLEQLRQEMQQQDRAAAPNQDLAKEVRSLRQELRSAAEWKQSNTMIHFAGLGCPFNRSQA